MRSRKLTAANLMEMADRACTTARLSLSHGDTDGAINRAWYAMFHAARAALLESGAPADPNIIRKPKGLIGAFDQYLVNHINPELSDMGRILNKTHEARIEADYKISFIKPETAKEIVEQAENFLAIIKGLDFATLPQHFRTENIVTLPSAASMTESRTDHIDPETEAAVRRFLALIAEQYEFEGALLYGSRARGTHNEDSDADVAVLMRGDQDFWAVKMDMAGIAFDALLETGILVSALPIWLDEWENPEDYSNPALLHNIKREGIRL